MSSAIIMPISWHFGISNNSTKEVCMSVKALIVGVNKYKLPGSDLQGCVIDATNISAKLSGMLRVSSPALSFSNACAPP